jgi:D-xylose transport system substrate-binding protein
VILDGKGVPKNHVNGTANNQYMDVPAVFLLVTKITLDNLSDVVKAGVWTWADTCKGIDTTDVCKKNQ